METLFDDLRANGATLCPNQPQIRVTRSLKAKRIYEQKPGTFVVDFGQNFAGTVRLRVKGPAGTVVTIRCARIYMPTAH